MQYNEIHLKIKIRLQSEQINKLYIFYHFQIEC